MDSEVVYGQITLYQDEPLAEDDDKENGEQNGEADLDGLTPAELEARYEKGRVMVRIIHCNFMHPRYLFSNIALSFICDSRARCSGLSRSEMSWHRRGLPFALSLTVLR